MAESSLAVTPGSGLNLRTNTRTIAATTVHEQALMVGEGNAATYTAIGIDQAVTTSGDHVLFIQGDGTNYGRLRRITIRQSTLAGAVGTLDLRLLRTSTAGSGGTAVSPRPFDAADTDPFAGTCQTRPSSKGTEGNQLLQFRLGITATNPMTNANAVEWRDDWNNTKPIIWGTSTANGLCLKVQTGVATVKIDVELEFVVTTFL